LPALLRVSRTDLVESIGDRRGGEHQQLLIRGIGCVHGQSQRAENE
jgi:hypothetical protein